MALFRRVVSLIAIFAIAGVTFFAIGDVVYAQDGEEEQARQESVSSNYFLRHINDGPIESSGFYVFCPYESCVNRSICEWIDFPKGTQTLVVNLLNVDDVGIHDQMSQYVQLDLSEDQVTISNLRVTDHEFLLCVSTEVDHGYYGILGSMAEG